MYVYLSVKSLLIVNMWWRHKHLPHNKQWRHHSTLTSNNPILFTCYSTPQSIRSHRVLVNGIQQRKRQKGKDPDTCCLYMSRLKTSSALQSRKWQLIGISWWEGIVRGGHMSGGHLSRAANVLPSQYRGALITRNSEQLDPRCSTQTYHSPNQPH